MRIDTRYDIKHLYRNHRTKRNFNRNVEHSKRKTIKIINISKYLKCLNERSLNFDKTPIDTLFFSLVKAHAKFGRKKNFLDEDKQFPVRS